MLYISSSRRPFHNLTRVTKNFCSASKLLVGHFFTYSAESILLAFVFEPMKIRLCTAGQNESNIILKP